MEPSGEGPGRLMASLLEFTVAPRAFALGRALARAGDASVDLCRFVPVGEQFVPYVWASADDQEGFREAVLDGRQVRAVEVVVRTARRWLYRIAWGDIDDELLSIVREHDLLVERAWWSGERWTFRLWAPGREAMGDFREHCRSAGVAVTIERIARDGHRDATTYGLTNKQREALLAALEAGYFDRGAGVSLVDLGETLGLSRQAVADRLDRGIANLLDNTVG